MNDLVFQIGLSRAGTQSLSEALRMLGYNPCHMGGNGELLYSCMFDGKTPFENLMGEGFDSFLDMMGLSTDHIDLIKYKLPTAKFIFLDRDYSSWHESFLKIEPQDEPFFHEIYSHKMQTKIEDNRTLVMNIIEGDGWEKLCPFLNKEIPSVDFPNKDFTRNY